MAPLLLPAECCLLLIDPQRHHTGGFDQARQQGSSNASSSSSAPASAAMVPCYFAVDWDAMDPEEWLAKPCQTSKPRVHALGDSGSSWSSSGIAAALAAEKRACLVLCGFSLETSVTFMALSALSSGFDVFLLMDVTPSRAEAARGPSSEDTLATATVERQRVSFMLPLALHVSRAARWAEHAVPAADRAGIESFAFGTSAPVPHKVVCGAHSDPSLRQFRTRGACASTCPETCVCVLKEELGGSLFDWRDQSMAFGVS